MKCRPATPPPEVLRIWSQALPSFSERHHLFSQLTKQENRRGNLKLHLEQMINCNIEPQM